MVPSFLLSPVLQPQAIRPRRSKLICASASPPTPPVKTPVYYRIPIFGVLFDFFIRKQPNITFARQLGPVYKVNVLGKEAMIIADLNAINTCYRNTAIFRSAGSFPKAFNALFGNDALFLLDGTDHINKRARVLPAFSPQLYASYFDAIRDSSNRLWSDVSSKVENSGRVSLKSMIKDHYFRIILDITSGGAYTVVDTVSKEEQYEAFRDDFNALATANFIFTIAPSWKRAVVAKTRLSGTLRSLIRKRLSERRGLIENLRAYGQEKMLSACKSGLRSGELDMLTMLCASSNLPTGHSQLIVDEDLDELANLVLLIWFAGYTTQSAATLCCIMLAGKDERRMRSLQDEQNKLVDEAESEEVTFEQVTKQTPLLDSYINEVLRLYPPATLLFRKAMEDTTVLGHEVKAGTIVALDVWGAQHDESYYPQSDELVMDRFLRQEDVPSPPAIASFGTVGGAHYCLGAALARVSMKTTLATLFRNYELGLEKGQRGEIRFIPEMMPVSGVVVDKCDRGEWLSNTSCSG